MGLSGGKMIFPVVFGTFVYRHPIKGLVKPFKSFIFVSFLKKRIIQTKETIHGKTSIFRG